MHDNMLLKLESQNERCRGTVSLHIDIRENSGIFFLKHFQLVVVHLLSISVCLETAKILTSAAGSRCGCLIACFSKGLLGAL